MTLLASILLMVAGWALLLSVTRALVGRKVKSLDSLTAHLDENVPR